MKSNPLVLQRLDELERKAEEVSRSKEYFTSEQGNQYSEIDASIVQGWASNVLNLLGRVFGKDSVHYSRFDSTVNKFNGFSEHFDTAFELFKAAKEDYIGGYLFDSRTLVQAEVFDDLLEQAEHLLSHGYFQAAAVIAGAVLEDGLRQLCDRNSVAVASNPKIDAMNADLTKAGVYNVLVQKQVTALADLRNKAAHGRWAEFSKPDVESMIPQVRTFLATHL